MFLAPVPVEIVSCPVPFSLTRLTLYPLFRSLPLPLHPLGQLLGSVPLPVPVPLLFLVLLFSPVPLLVPVPFRRVFVSLSIHFLSFFVFLLSSRGIRGLLRWGYPHFWGWCRRDSRNLTSSRASMAGNLSTVFVTRNSFKRRLRTGCNGVAFKQLSSWVIDFWLCPVRLWTRKCLRVGLGMCLSHRVGCRGRLTAGIWRLASRRHCRVWI